MSNYQHFPIIIDYVYKNIFILSRLIREILLKQKLLKGDDLKKLTDSTNDNVKKISIIEQETKEVCIDN